MTDESKQEDQTGISRRALYFAKQIDHLPPGEYNLILQKPHITSAPWHTVFYKVERFQVLDIKKNED